MRSHLQTHHPAHRESQSVLVSDAYHSWLFCKQGLHYGWCGLQALRVLPNSFLLAPYIPVFPLLRTLSLNCLRHWATESHCMHVYPISNKTPSMFTISTLGAHHQSCLFNMKLVGLYLVEVHFWVSMLIFNFHSRFLNQKMDEWNICRVV